MSTELPERVEHDSLENYRRKYPGGDKSDHTFGYKLEELARTIPNRPAFIQGDRRVTYKEFDDEVNRLANALLDLGIKKEDRVAVMGFTSIEWKEISYAVFKIGAILATINPRQHHRETLHVLKDSESVAVFLDDEYIDVIDKIRGDLPLLKYIIVYRRTGKEVPVGMLDYEELKGRYPTTKPKLDWKVTNEDICLFYYTGGTTGVPKGTVWDYENNVGLTKKNMGTSLAGGELIEHLSRLPRKTYEVIGGMLPVPGLGPIVGRLLDSKGVRRILSYELIKESIAPLALALAETPLIYRIMGGNWLIKQMPVSQLFHGSGWTGPNALQIGLGCTMYFLTTSHPFNPKEFLETVERERINVVFLSGNPFFLPVAEELERDHYDTSSLFVMLSPGALLTPDVKKRVLDKIPGLVIMDEIGTTEDLSAIPSIHTAEDKKFTTCVPVVGDIKKGVYKSQHPSRVINPKTGKDVKPGEIGEFIAGGCMCNGYWKMPKKTAETFREIDGERYIFVGDDATVDEEGRLKFVGRSGTMINTGGENVYCEEVEDALHKDPKVNEAIVIGVPDEKWGEAVTAVVELKKGETATEEEIRNSLRDEIAGFKIPKNVIFTDKIEKTAAAKVIRREWKKFAMDKLGIRE